VPSAGRRTLCEKRLAKLDSRRMRDVGSFFVATVLKFSGPKLCIRSMMEGIRLSSRRALGEVQAGSAPSTPSKNRTGIAQALSSKDTVQFLSFIEKHVRATSKGDLYFERKPQICTQRGSSTVTNCDKP
jgi:hypothetical protein